MFKVDSKVEVWVWRNLRCYRWT